MIERILLIRRDNIGDLVLTTPLIAALRKARPDAWIGFLANSYNAPVLSGNPHLDAIYAYDKAKHRPDEGRWRVYAGTARTLLTLRRLKIDSVILAGPAPQRQALALARWIAPRKMIGFVTAEFAPRSITLPVAYAQGSVLHETQDVFRLLAPLGVGGHIPPCAVYADRQHAGALRTAVDLKLGAAGRLIGVQISARRARQRWPVERFAQLMTQLHASNGARFMLFWAPGSEADARHPGDDGRARQLLDLLPSGFPVFAHSTAELPGLISGLSLVEALITPDGGAMHLAAGLGKPVIALFGDSPAARWHPWRVPHEIVQGKEGEVGTIAVAEVLSAWERLAPTVSG
jgi:ADP-heptose:LPS heptosyltransferase